MILKSGVKFGNSAQAIMAAMIIVQSVYNSHQIEFVITSFNDSTHSTNSLHYKDCAFDVRTKNIPTRDLKIQMVNEIKNALTIDYDVILEGLGTGNEHLHLEWQPK